MPKNGGIVYSTEHGRMCPACERPIADCSCRNEDVAPKTDGVVRVARDAKGRNGRVVTVITGVPVAAAELSKLAKELKRRAGSGGTVKAGVIEIQGDHRDMAAAELEKRGYRVRRIG